MKILVVGGKLQGFEITLLAQFAGWHVTVLDKNPQCLASVQCDSFINLDILELNPNHFKYFDLVFPGIEDNNVLNYLQNLCQIAGVPFVHNEFAYQISTSKRKTNSLLDDIGVLTPPSVEDSLFSPTGYIVKPDKSSCSEGVQYFKNRNDAIKVLSKNKSLLGQIFLEGKVFSIEVLFKNNKAWPLVVTEVVIDQTYDCHRIVSPVYLDNDSLQKVNDIARSIGSVFSGVGLFDIEFIFFEGDPYVLEIDARIPSQTPLAVYFSTGINIIEELGVLFSTSHFNRKDINISEQKDTILQHLEFDIKAKSAHCIGEGCLGNSLPFKIFREFHDAKLTYGSFNKKDNNKKFITFVCSANTLDEAKKELHQSITKLKAGAG